jgi:GWxTD domain-containing protein
MTPSCSFLRWSAALAWLSATGFGFAQLQTGKASGGPFFFLDAANFASKDTSKGRVEAFVKVAHSELLFTKFQDNLFRAQYEISYSIYNKTTHTLVAREIQDRQVITDKYAETTSDLRFHFSRITFEIAPGDYYVHAVLTDRETQKFGQRRMDILVRTFREKEIGVSDLIFADRIQKDTLSDIINIVPNVFKSFDNDFKRYLVYFEIYDGRFAFSRRDSLGQLPAGTDRISLRYRVLDKGQNVVVEDSMQKEIGQFQTFTSIEIDKQNISYGKYILDVSIHRDGQRASSKSVFDVRLSTFSNPTQSAAFDLDEAIRQMRHVARNVNLGKILKGTKDEKARFFAEFWKTKDPTPSTEKNELMEEYYRRIDYANRYFHAGYRDGWESDRGMVYVILEAPDDIERHPYESDSKPYEIWYYYQFNLKLYFIDYQGFGDYELFNRQEFETYVFIHR